MTDRRIGDVEMARMLISFSPRTVNALAATPGVDFMPVPTRLTLATFSSMTTSRALISGTTRSRVSLALERSAAGHVNEMSVKPSSETFWMIMSVLTMLPASELNTRAAMPVASGTPRMVTLTSDVSCAMPVITASSIMLQPSLT